MKKLLLLLLITNCSLLTVNAQIQFQRTVGGTMSEDGRSIVQTTDGGYVLAGRTSSFGAGNQDMYIVKLDAGGTLQWSRTVGGTSEDGGFSIIQTIDGGYAITGRTYSFGTGNKDMYIVKLDAGGALQWSRTVGGTANEDAWSIIQTTDGGYVVAGNTNSFGAGLSDMFIVRLDSSGTYQWCRTIGGTADENASSVKQTTNGGYIVAGSTNSFGVGLNDIFIVKLDGNGTLLWSKTVGGTNSDGAGSIILNTDGGYTVAGVTASFSAGDYDFYIVKLDTSGTILWSKTVGGTGTDGVNSIIQTTDGGFAAAGWETSFGTGNVDMYIVKLDASGTFQWSRTIMEGSVYSDQALSIIQTTGGGLAVAGYYQFVPQNSDFFIAKLDGTGNTCGNTSSPSPALSTGGTTTSPTPTVIFPAPTVTLPPSSSGTGGTVTTFCLVGIQPISTEIPNQFSLSQNYPNPFNPTTKIRFSLPKNSFVKIVVFDALGKEVQTLVNEQINPGTYSVDWDGANYPSGVYFYKIIAGGFSETKKLMLIK